ncbi:MAG: hypothetical protein ABJL67_00915 [Sulfitobacter sp.]
MDSLKFIMRLNAASCICFALLFLVQPQSVAMFLGEVPKTIIIVLGVGLLVNGAHLILASRRNEILQKEVIWFSLGDFGWWLMTLALIVAKLWITAPWGIAVAALVATIVAGLGVAQLWTLGRHLHGHTNKEHLNAFGKSWMAFPLWVKIWLVFLNGVFLAAFAFLPDRSATIILVAYVATGPLLAGQVGYDAGLRRILAVAHLVPWIPLLAWLLVVPDGSPYTTLLSATVAICLAFDINDLWLFLKGDRAVLGASQTGGS